MAITQMFTYSCSNAAVGGISKLYIGNASELTATYASGVVTAMAYASGKKFYEIGFEDDGCTFTEAIEVTNNKVLYKPEYKVKIGSRTATAKLWIDNLQGCDRYMLVHIERPDPTLKWITGFTPTQGLRLLSGTSQTGGTMAEDNMIELTFGHPTGVQYPCSTFTGTLTI